VSRLNPSRPFPQGTRKKKRRRKKRGKLRGAKKRMKAMLARVLVPRRECSSRAAR
jgi:hypothetical protein